MADQYAFVNTAISGPAIGGFAITPNDSTEFDQPTRFFRVGGAGTVAVVTTDGSELTFTVTSVPEVIDVRAKKIKATGTTATGIIGLY